MPDDPPPYPSHERAVDRMTAEERLKSLQEYAEDQKYVRPGDGTLNMSGPGITQFPYGGHMMDTAYKRALPPPEYDVPASDGPSRGERKSSVSQVLQRLLGSKESKEASVK